MRFPWLASPSMGCVSPYRSLPKRFMFASTCKSAAHWRRLMMWGVVLGAWQPGKSREDLTLMQHTQW